MKFEISELSKYYGKKCALQKFSYYFKPGIYGILGANGAGKSTLMKLITDNALRSGGKILYNGKDILEWGRLFREKVGYMPQEQGIFPKMTVNSFLRYMASVKGCSRKESLRQIPELLKVVNLQDKAYLRLESLSGGMKQRVLLAQALLGSPNILLLDEPTAGLDPGERIRLREYIAKLGKDKIVLLSTHIVFDVEKCADRILLMKDGVLIADGTPDILIKQVKGRDLEDVYLYYIGGPKSREEM